MLASVQPLVLTCKSVTELVFPYTGEEKDSVVSVCLLVFFAEFLYAKSNSTNIILIEKKPTYKKFDPG